MKHSFFLVIPKQTSNPQRLREFDEKVLRQWISELPIANPLLASRLVYDYIAELNSIKMPTQLRLDALENLRPSYLSIEDYLLSRLLKTDFPKEENEKKTLKFLVSLQREFTLAYWITLKELTGSSSSWFQGKNVALSIQRCIKGLSSIVKSHYVMGLPIPDWIWMDLHSLYKLSSKQKKQTIQIPQSSDQDSSKSCSPEEAYIEILLLALAEPKGLMQREINLVYHFAGIVHGLVGFKNQPVANQHTQCVVFVDDDRAPVFLTPNSVSPEDSLKLYIDFSALFALFDSGKIPHNPAESRFAGLSLEAGRPEHLSLELLSYLKDRWSGIPLRSASLFSDRVERLVSIGMNSFFKARPGDTPASDEDDLEFTAESISERLLSHVFKKPGLISIGSLVSFRRIDAPANRRALGVIEKLIVEKENGKISFGVHLLTPHAIAVTYYPSAQKSMADTFKRGLFYQLKEPETKNYLIADTFLLKPGDVIRLFIEQEEFTIILSNKKNIGLGYWQFECAKST